MSEVKEMDNDRVAVAKMIAAEVMDEVGENAEMCFAFLWGHVKGCKKTYRVLLGASRSFSNWDEVMSKIEKDCPHIGSLWLNWD